jgi:hypothetical protein
LVAQLRQTPNVSSIQITFHEEKPPKDHSMPPGGFRLAIINCLNLETGFAVREKLALSFWSTHQFLLNPAPAPKIISDPAAELH